MTSRAFRNTRPTDFHAFRATRYERLEADYRRFALDENLPMAWSLSDVYRNDSKLLWKFMDRYHYLQKEDDLDLMLVLQREGISYPELCKHFEWTGSHNYLYLFDEFYESSLGAMALRLPFVSKDRLYIELMTLSGFRGLGENAWGTGAEDVQLSNFFKHMLLKCLTGKAVNTPSNYNKWLPQDEMCNLLTCDGSMDERLAQKSIDDLMARHRHFDQMHDFHPLHTDRALPNPSGHESLIQILIRTLVYDKGVIMHLEDVDQNEIWRVLQSTARMLAHHINPDPDESTRLASQMVINALSIFESGLPDKPDRHQVFGDFREPGKTYSRLETLVYAGPMQAHRLDANHHFNTSASIDLNVSFMEQLYGKIQPSELVSSHLAHTPFIGDIASIRQIRGIEACIDEIPDSPFLYLCPHIPSVSQVEAHKKSLVRSALLLMDYQVSENKTGSIRVFGTVMGWNNYAIRPADAEQESLILSALCAKGTPTPELLEVCNLSRRAILQHLDDLGEIVREQYLAQDLGL